MHSAKTKKVKGVSQILGTLVFLLIAASMLTLMIYFINNYANYSARSIEYLQTISQEPMIFETWHNGVVELATNRPFVITHIILPNGQILNTSMVVQNAIAINKILNGQPWAIIVTNYGTWYNVTPLYLPTIIYPDPNVLYSGIPWNSSALQVGIKPNFFAVLKGVMLINQTPVRINAESNILYETGYTNETIVAYVANDTGTLIIYFYAPAYYVSKVENEYWKYYTLVANPIDKAEYGLPNVNDDPLFYMLLTSNPYAYAMPSLWYSAIYWKNEMQTIVNPQGGLYYNFTYVIATLGIYIPVNDSSGNIGYLYIPISVFEVTNLSALVPQKVTPPNPVLPYAFPAKYYNASWTYCPYSWIVSPLQPSPPTGEITEAYNSSKIFNISGYYYYYNNSGIYLMPYTAQFVPVYEDFPSAGYGGFPSYFGNSYEYLESFLYSVNDPAYHQSVTIHKVPAPGAHGPIYMNVIQKGLFSYIDYLLFTKINPAYNIYATGGNPNNFQNNPMPYDFYAYYNSMSYVTLLHEHNDLVQLFALEINFPQDEIELYGFDSATGNWILIYQAYIGNLPAQNFQGINFEFVHALPIYIEVPYGTYITAASFSNQTIHYL